jgi:hypothetical protein
MLLAFGPFRSLIRDMRLVRNEKYPLVFKMVQRLAMVGAAGRSGASIPTGALEKGDVLTVEAAFGQFLPSDQSEVIKAVKELLAAHAISRETALRWLHDAGVPIDDDMQSELDAIAGVDFEGAKALADATGSEEMAARYVGREDELEAPTAAAEVPPPEPPTPGGQPPAPGSEAPAGQ